MNTIKKTLPAVLAAILISAAMLLAPVKAYADVISPGVEPSSTWDYGFMEEDGHVNNCVECGYTYVVNGSSGSLDFYYSPESYDVKQTYENGEYVQVEAIYTDPDGKQWAAVWEEAWRAGYYYYLVWAPMAYLQCEDSSISEEAFTEQYTIPEIKYIAGATLSTVQSETPVQTVQNDSPDTTKTVIITCAAVGVVAAAAVVLIVVILKKKKNK